MHTASLGDAEQWPSLPLYRTYRTHAGPQAEAVRTPVWFRIVALAHYRGQVDDCAYRLARHVSQWAHKSGRIPDMGDVMDAYQHYYGLGRRTAWADVRRLGIHGAGYIRQTAAPAPGRTASYALCLPETLPAGLPGDLEAELTRVLARPTRYTVTTTTRTDADPAKAVAEQETITRVSSTRVQSHETLSDLPMYSRGSVLTPNDEREEEAFPTWLHTSPFSRGFSTPAPPKRQPRRTRQGRQIGDEKDTKEKIARILRQCAPRWQEQRGTAGGLSPEAAERLTPLLRGALGYQTSSDIADAITEAVASARDLGAVVATRLRRIITRDSRARHLDTVKADDQGKRYAEVVQERAQRSAETMQNPRTRQAIGAARAAIEAARSVPVGLADRPRTPAARTSGARWTERPEDHARALAAAGIPTTDTAWQTAREEARREEARRAAVAYARTGHAIRHTAPGPRLDEAAAAMWQEGEPAF